jgi:hypothetical protein
MNTDDLIERLARSPEPVRVLPPPAARAAAWVLGTAVYVGALALAMMAVNGVEWAAASAAFWWSLAASVAAGVLASVAAFASVVPGAQQRAGWGALAAAALWLVASASVPVVDWSTVATANHEWLCVGFIVLGGAPLGVLLVRLLRRGAPLTPVKTAAFAALAVGALANAGACLSLPHDNGAVTLAWHGGILLALIAGAALWGRRLFSWRRPA